MKGKNKSLKDFVGFAGMSYPKLVGLGFLAVIIIGTLLLMLPAANRDGVSPPVTDAFFTAVSATCVTGLVVFDTYQHWTLFGQIVIITLIQIGGLGFMTVMTMFSILVRRKIGLRERELLQESVNMQEMSGIVRMMRRIVAGTFMFELAGAVLLSFRFIPKMGAAEGIYNSLFLSISAFCNAGFDLNGKYGEYSSLVEFQNDAWVLITLMLLILIGSIGFFVWDDIRTNKLRFRRYRLHTKLALIITLGLTFAGALLFFILEQDDTLKGMGTGRQILSAFFLSVSPRTAGFNSVDLAELSPASRLVHLFYMFIGGNPGSTAGGAKTTTVAVLFISAWSSLRNYDEINVLGRRLESDVLKKSVTVIVVNLVLIMLSTVAISAVQREIALGDIAFETFSAVNTVGMTTGITRDFNTLSKLIVAFLMFCGRVGSVSFVLVFAENKKYAGMKNPVEKISIG
ncbi:MAG: TrkH family potassium uptake protein [Oscillospiraceae bacterium]|nr:TrkH family potassium uptake protein [Oscillospiraceae bacterium]